MAIHVQKKASTEEESFWRNYFIKNISIRFVSEFCLSVGLTTNVGGTDSYSETDFLQQQLVL